MANDIEELARQMLNAAWERRTTAWDVPDVVAPRDTAVVRELGFEDQNAPELVSVEKLMKDRGYIVPAPIVGGGRSLEGFYTLTSAGHGFLREAP